MGLNRIKSIWLMVAADHLLRKPRDECGAVLYLFADRLRHYCLNRNL